MHPKTREDLHHSVETVETDCVLGSLRVIQQNAKRQIGEKLGFLRSLRGSQEMEENSLHDDIQIAVIITLKRRSGCRNAHESE